MPWYKSGTVAITAGQTSVVGTNTDFAANARVGDAFQGPDGRWYEVANIASATVLSILPAYQGATVAAGLYGLAPMQGYVKESADRLRQIVEQWGSTLASLGAVATENVVPIAKGGTGGITQADARANLGLVRTTSPTDSTVGRLLGVGDHGYGGYAPARSTTALETLTKGGTRALNGGSSGLPSASPALVHIFPWDNDTSALRIVHPVVGDESLDVYLGKRAGSTEYPLRRIVHSGNIVGTATQSAGVPTGAIIERGSNANGKYVKYADGTMICTGVSAAGVVTSVAFGQIYTNTATTFTFPAAFAAVPVVAPAVGYVSGAPVWGGVDSASTTGCSIRVFSGGSNGGGQPKYIAVGRWFA